MLKLFVKWNEIFIANLNLNYEYNLLTSSKDCAGARGLLCIYKFYADMYMQREFNSIINHRP